MGITLSEALKNELITAQTYKTIPKCECGSIFEFSDSMKALICTNKDCIYKTIHRIELFCEKLGIDTNKFDMIQLVKSLKIVTPYQMLMLDSAYTKNVVNIRSIQGINELLQNIKRVKEREYFISNIVELCGIRTIENIAYKIFDGFNSIEDAFNEIETGQLAFLNERLGIKSSDSSIISVEIFNILKDIKEELIFGETQLKIKEHTNIIRIAFSDNILPFINKSELIDYLNYKFKYKFVVATTVGENTDILIKNVDSNNSKYRTAKIINDKHIANAMNNNGVSFNDIGKKVEGELKPLGNKIYIDTLSNVLDRLEELSKNEW